MRVVPDEDAEAIPVEGHGQPVPCSEAAQQGEIAVQVFGGAEVEGHDGARRIVDGAEEEDAGAGAEPVELAAVHQHEGAQAGTARAAGAVLRRPAPALGRQAQGPAKPADGTAADGQALELAEVLGGVAVIEVPVGGLDQLGHAVADLDVKAPWRRPAPVAMDQAPHPLGPIPGLEAAELPEADLQGVGPFRGGDLPGHRRLHRARPAGLLATHRDGLPCLHGRTFLLNS